jgi:hypothetical protein
MVLLLLLLFITFIQGIYTYIPETSYAPRVYSFATILIYNLCHMLCYFPCEMFLNFTLVFSEVRVKVLCNKTNEMH